MSEIRTADTQLEDKTRRRSGSFYTKEIWAAEAHKSLDAELGVGWRDSCIVWDCCSGTGNLTRDFKFKDLILSTLTQAEVDMMVEDDVNPEAKKYVLDFLNMSAVPSEIDAQLKFARVRKKRLVFLMNPPYATQGVMGSKGKSKAGVAKTKVRDEMQAKKLGKANSQLYTQFMFKCNEIAKAYGFKEVTVAVFSKPMFMCSGSFIKFRSYWYNAYEYKSGFMFRANEFDGVKGSWGVSFTIWNEGSTVLNQDLPIMLKEREDDTIKDLRIKMLYTSEGREASKWVREPVKAAIKKAKDTVKLSSGLKVKDGGDYTKGMPDGSAGVFCNHSNNVMKSTTDVFYISAMPSDKARLVIPLDTNEGWRRAVALCAARSLEGCSWHNACDEYLKPVDSPKFSSGLRVREVEANEGGVIAGSLGVMFNKGNNLSDNSSGVSLLSGKPTDKGRGNFELVRGEGWRRAISLCAARGLTESEWHNDKDEYLKPVCTKSAYDKWVDDCHIYLLLENKNNMTSMRQVDYKGKKWDIFNHYFFLTRDEAHTLYAQHSPTLLADLQNTTHEPYFAEVLPSLTLSPLAQEVLDDLKALHVDSIKHRATITHEGELDLHLGAWDAGVYQHKKLWYQVPELLAKWNALKVKHKKLKAQLAHGVYTFGFLKK